MNIYPICHIEIDMKRSPHSLIEKYPHIQLARRSVDFDIHQAAKSHLSTVCPKKSAHGFVVLCFVVVMQSFIMNSHEVFIHIYRSCFAGTAAIVRMPQCQWSKPGGYGKISQCITTTKHSKANTVCIFLEIYCKGVPLFTSDSDAIRWTILEVVLNDDAHWK